MEGTKVVVFGCQKIAIDILRFLSAREDVDVPLVVTYEIPTDISKGQQ